MSLRISQPFFRRRRFTGTDQFNLAYGFFTGFCPVLGGLVGRVTSVAVLACDELEWLLRLCLALMFFGGA